MPKIFSMLFQHIAHYENLGYRFNPFRSLTEEEFEQAFPPNNIALEAISGDFQALQIVGRSGAGKTSLLRQIIVLLKTGNEDLFYYYVNKSGELPDFSSASYRWVILDEAQRLRRQTLAPQLARWKGRGVKLILGSHMDHETWVETDFATKTIYLSRVFAARFAEIARHRLEFAAAREPLHHFSKEAILAWINCSDCSFETARAIGFEIFLDKGLPGEITPEIVEKAAKELKENRFVA